MEIKIGCSLNKSQIIFRSIKFDLYETLKACRIRINKSPINYSGRQSGLKFRWDYFEITLRLETGQGNHYIVILGSRRNTFHGVCPSLSISLSSFQQGKCPFNHVDMTQIGANLVHVSMHFSSSFCSQFVLFFYSPCVPSLLFLNLFYTIFSHEDNLNTFGFSPFSFSPLFSFTPSSFIYISSYIFAFPSFP